MRARKSEVSMRYAVVMVVALLLLPSPLDIPWIDVTMPVPAPYTSYIEKDAQEIVDRGWGIVEPGEFYHGHILLGPAAAERMYFISFEDALSYAVGALYHTDEHIDLWEAQANRHPSERTPRSIVSFWGKGMIPASLLVPNPDKNAWHYSGFGTIKAWDLYRARPDLFFDALNYEIRFSNSRCETVLQFNIRFGHPLEGGITVDGRRYGLDFSCRPGRW